MRITKRQLRRIIKEAMPAGGVPDVVGAISGVPGGNIQNLVEEYKEWATEYMGTASGANSASVLATFIVDKGLDQTEMGDDIVKDMAAAMKFSTSDVKREVTQARKEYDAGGTLSDAESHRRSFYERKNLREGKVRITKQYLRRIISEYRKERLNEYSEHESHSDLSDHMEDMLSQLDDVMIKYVDSGWLAAQDQESLALDLEDLHEKLNQLNNTFGTLAARGTTR